MTPRIELPRSAIEDFCRRWNISKLELFGSVLRDDFKPDSDVDFLYTFTEDSHRTLFDLVEMEEELSALVSRRVDLISRNAVETSKNWIKQREILSKTESIYVA